jgi:hypothetical protein
MSERNNEQRLAADQPASVSMEQKEDKKLDLLSFLNPTEVVDLPSKGKFYPKGHPLHGKDTVEIRFMTAKEEDILTSKSLLKKGIAVDRMLESVIVDKSVKLDDLLVGDKNALIVAARVTGYGSEYETKVQCPSCGTSVRHSFDLENTKHTFPTPEVEKQLVESGTFKVKLPICKLEVEVRLLTGQDEKLISKITEERKAAKMEDSYITDQMRTFIVSVNGVREREMINKFVDVCPAGDAKLLRKMFVENVPNLDMTQKFTCRSCEAEMEMEVPFTVDFFWPGR